MNDIMIWLTHDDNGMLVIVAFVIIGLALCMRGPKHGYEPAAKDDEHA